MAAGILVILLYAGLGVAFVGLAVGLYLLAVSTRKRYRCPVCGETMRVEWMDAKRCGMCGAPLNRNGN